MVTVTSSPQRRRKLRALPYVVAGLLWPAAATTAFAADSVVVGTISTIAGVGTQGFTGDGGPATLARLSGPMGVAVDAAGNVFFVDNQNNRIRKVAAATGVITTVAGGGPCCASGDGGPATSARLDSPRGLAVDSAGNLYIADTGNQKIRKITAATGIIATVAGSGASGFGGDGGQATAAQLYTPYTVALDSVGNLYIADLSNSRIRKVTAATGVITTIAGSGVAGYSGDGGAATLAQLQWPQGVAVDGAGDVYIADSGNYRVRKLTVATGIITTVAGNGTFSNTVGESVPATTASVRPDNVFVDTVGNFYVVRVDRIHKVSIATGTIATVAGSGTAGFGGDGGPAPGGQLNNPSAAAIDAHGNIYIGDSSNHRIRKVSTPTVSPAFSTIAGTGVAGYSGDGGNGTLAQLNRPSAVAVDGNGDVYVGDYNNSRVRRISGSTGMITTVAGTGTAGFTGDAGPATAARVNGPFGLAIDGAGNVYIADTFNYRIRMLTVATGIITTIAGNGGAGSTGDSGPATDAQLNQPTGVAVDGAGNVFIAEDPGARIRKVAAGTGIITTVAGLGTLGFAGDGGPATNAQLRNPAGVAVDAAGNLYIADYANTRIRKVTAATGIITTIAGGGVCCATGDGFAATAALLSGPFSVALDPAGNVYVGDIGADRVRRVTVSTGKIFTIAGSGTEAFGGEGGVPSAAHIRNPYGVAVAADGTFYVADRDNHRVRKAVSVITEPPWPGGGPTDFDGDGRPDIVVYRPSAGQWYALTSLSGFTAYGTYPLGAPGGPGDVPVPGDYDRDGRADIAMWRPSTGVWTVLLSTSGYTASSTYSWGVASDVPVPGDYDGDGQTDYAVWRPASGTWYVAKSTGGSLVSVWGVGTDRPVPADYDGDTKTDIAVYRPSTGVWYVLTSSSGFTGSTSATWGVRTDIPVPGDYDGDGHADLAVFRPATGTWYVLTSTGGSFAKEWGVRTDRVVPGDYDGDHKTDIAVYRPSTGTWYVLTSSSNFAASAEYHWGASADVALGSVAPYRDPTRRGDLDGDRVTDLGVYRPSTGTWYTLLSRNGFTTLSEYAWGASGDLPVRGDYDGDALPDVAVYRPSTGAWYIRTSSSGYANYEAYQWGSAGDVPVPADYDGDGETDVAVYRPGTGTWYVLNSSSHFTLYTTYVWGSPGDVPVPRDYDGDGTADVAVYRPSTGTWYVLTSGSSFTASVSYAVGGASDVPVPGDYDGDGLTDVAVYRPSTGVWMLRTSGSNYALTSYTWGLSTDTAVPGDYDGDGRTDVAVYRPSTGVWYVLLSSTNFTVFTTYTWGASTDVTVQ